MANLEQEDDDSKHAKMSSDVSNLMHLTTGEMSTSIAVDTAAIPCLIPTFADACKLVKAPYSCLVLDTHRRHVALSPMYLKKKRTGIQEELNAELLKYSESLKGVPLAYDNISILGHHGDIYDDQGYIHLNIEAAFVIFNPKRGQKLVGVINKVGVSHVGCLVHGCFNASILKPSQMTQDMWRDSGLRIGGSLEFQVSQLDADAAGVLLIRARLKISRVQELLGALESSQGDGAEEQAPPAAGPASESTDGAKTRKKKKKRDKHKDEEVAPHPAVAEGSREAQDANGTEADANSNGRHKEKKKKKKRDRREEEEEEARLASPADVPGSDSSGYISDKSSRKRKEGPGGSDIGVREGTALPVAKKKKNK